MHYICDNMFVRKMLPSCSLAVPELPTSNLWIYLSRQGNVLNKEETDLDFFQLLFIVIISCDDVLIFQVFNLLVYPVNQWVIA